MWGWLNYLGVLAGGLSLFSLVHRHWNFDLAIFSAQVLEFYRELIHPIGDFFGWILSTIFHVRPSADAVVIYLLLGASLARFLSPYAMVTMGRSLDDKPTIGGLARLAGATALYILVWPIATLFTAYEVVFLRNTETAREWLLEIGKALLAFFVFFLLNAGLT